MKRCLTLLLALSLLLAVSLSVHAGHWAQFRGPNATGIVTGENIPVQFNDKTNLLWKVAIPGLGNASPVVWENNVFVHTSTSDGKERILVCLDAATGKTLWSRTVPAVIHKTHTKNTLASATPVTDGQSVYVPFWDGKDVLMTAYNFKGDLLWQKNLGFWISQHGTGASPILHKDKLIFANDMDKEDPETNAPVPRPSILYALNKKTGDIAWQVEREAFRACYTVPMILDKGAAPELLVTSTTAITSYNPETGSPNWSWAGKFSGRKWPLRTIAPTIHVDGLLYACSGDGGGDRHMLALQLQGPTTPPTTVWQTQKDSPYVPGLLHKDGYIFAVNDLGFAGCYEAKTGKRVWFQRISDTNVVSSPVMIDGNIYAPSEGGDVYVFAAQPTFKLLAQNPLGERFRALPAVADGRLYLRGQNHLFCIGKTGEK